MAELKQFPLVTVIGSETVVGQDGAPALVLHTREAGAVAFAVNQQAIETIRKQLDKLELAFRQPSGKA